MIPRFQFTPARLDRFRRGPLAPHIDQLAKLLSEQGYSNQVGMQKLRLAALLSRWLQQSKSGLSNSTRCASPIS